MSLPAYEIVTLVTHHPSRPICCLLETLESLERATTRPHLIHVVEQGQSELRDLYTPNAFSWAIVDLKVTTYEKNEGPVTPRIDSLKLAKSLPSVQWWAKLDDDGTVSPGAWDALIEALEADEDAGYAMASPNGDTPPKMRNHSPGAVTLEPGHFGEFSTPRSHGWRCTFVGDGATVFRLSFFDDVAYDPRFLRGADVDLSMQAGVYDYHCLLCDTPSSVHQHAKCSPVDYDRVRYDAELVWDAARTFRAKWGVDCPHLSQFGVRNA